MSNLLRPNRNAAHTRVIGHPLAVSSDTNARQNPGPTNSPCRQEFVRSHFNEVATVGESKRHARIQSGSRREIGCGSCPATAGSDLNEHAILLIDRIRFHPFDASKFNSNRRASANSSPSSSKSIPKVLCLASNASCRNYVVELAKQRFP